VPRDRDASFEPKIVRKRQRRLGGVEDLVVSLVAKGLTTGEVQAHLAEIYGTDVSRQTISTITDRVLEGLAAWRSRPLDAVYPVLFIDAIHVKLRDGQVANRPVYVALGVSVDGERDILGLWAGDGGEGAKDWLHVLTELKNRGVADCCIVVCDGLAGLPDAIATVWPAAVTQTCIVHLLPKQLPLCRSAGLGRHRPRPQADLYRRDRGGRAGGAGELRRGLGGPLPSHRQPGPHRPWPPALDQPLEGRAERLRHRLRRPPQRRQEVALPTPVTPFT
jgi:Transposase, Mutator family